MTAPRPPWSEAQWWEVHFRWPNSVEMRIDRRRRSKETCERLAAEMRASGNYMEVWLVEVNRFSRGPDPRRTRRG